LSGPAKALATSTTDSGSEARTHQLFTRTESASGARWNVRRLAGIALQILAFAVVGWRVLEILQQSSGFDAHAYWIASLDHPYGRLYESRDAYLYSPAFIQLLAPIRLLPFAAFFAIWVLLATGALVWLVGPVVAALVLLPGSYSPVYQDIWFGNITIFLTVALTVGFRFPGVWSAFILTKLTPGIGLLWFTVRGEWRSLAIVLGVTALITAISFVLAPHLWFEWLGALRDNAAKPEVAGWEVATWPLRLAAAAALIVLAARVGAAWVLPLALFIAQPLTWFIGFSFFLALFGWWRHKGLRPHRTASRGQLPAPLSTA
jgi:hypothetical protein